MRRYRTKARTRLFAICGLAVALVFPLLLVFPVEDLLAEKLGMPVVLVQLYITAMSLLGIWRYLWVLTERVEVHEDRIVHRATGITTTVRYEDITHFSPKAGSALRKRIRKGAWMVDAYGNAILVTRSIEHFKEIVDYIGSRCASPERRPRALPTHMKVLFAFAVFLNILIVLGLLFSFGVL